MYLPMMTRGVKYGARSTDLHANLISLNPGLASRVRGVVKWEKRASLSEMRQGINITDVSGKWERRGSGGGE